MIFIFLNDTIEFEEAVRILRIAVERNKSSMDKELYAILTDKEVLSEIKSYSQRYTFYPPINKNRDIDSVKLVCNVYTCSFSIDGDLLPMWNYYAQGTDGISINFTDLKDCMESNEKIKIVMGKVWYIEDDKIQCIDALLKDILAFFSEIPDKKCRGAYDFGKCENVGCSKELFEKPGFDRRAFDSAKLLPPGIYSGSVFGLRVCKQSSKSISF